jgi:hypothetical protein
MIAFSIDMKEVLICLVRIPTWKIFMYSLV